MLAGNGELGKFVAEIGDEFQEAHHFWCDAECGGEG
jgi:hypothetical protein